MRIRENVPLGNLTTMRLGGRARFVLEVTERGDVPEAYRFARERNLPTFVLGGGANSLGRDEGFAGAILLCKIREIEVFAGADRPKSSPSPPKNAESQKDKIPDARRPVNLQENITANRQEVAISQNVNIAANQQNPGQNLSKNFGSAENLQKFSSDEILLRAGAGEKWDDLCRLSAEAGFSGIEALSSIPGSVGAAPVQNIGAYGQEVSEVFVNLEAYDTKTQKFVTLNKANLRFGYRHSILNSTARGRYFVTAVTLKLKRGKLSSPLYRSLQSYLDERGITDFSPANIRRAVMAIRREKLPDPLTIPSAGSFFKNISLETEEEKAEAESQGLPVLGEAGSWKIPTAWLIEQAGLKGELLHGMRVSAGAPLVLINESAQSFADLASARAEIRARIKEKFGFDLEQEPEEIG